MKKLKIILNSKKFYLIIFLFLTIHIIYNFNFINKSSKFIKSNTNFICTIENYHIDGNMLKMNLDCKEKLIGYYYFDFENELLDFETKYKIGDIIKINGTLEEINSNSTPNIFDYKQYCYIRNIFYKLKIEKIDYIKKSSNYVYIIKGAIFNKIKKLKSFPYINAFVLKDTNYIDNNILSAYKKIGIMHLFSVSGMHVGILVLIINILLKKFDSFKNFLIILILLIYYNIIGSVSLLRAFLFFTISFFNKKFNLSLSIYKIILLLTTIIILKNPYYLYDTGFLYSIVISSGLLLSQNKIRKIKNYFLRTLYISIISFILSFPITIYNYFEINLLSFLYNTFIIPIVSIIIFPLCLITILFPVFDNILSVLITILEFISLIFSRINSTIILMKPTLFIVFFYYAIILLCMKNKRFYFLFLFSIIIHYNYNILSNKDYIVSIDVGQGDSFLVHSGNNNILIDTGGIANYNNEEWKKAKKYSIVENITIPLLKSLGIYNIDILIITHGDFDHGGEAVNLIENFSVEKVYFNSNEFNNLEKIIIDMLKKKEINYEKINKKIEKIGNILLFSTSFPSDNENDSSIINCIFINNYKMLLTSDISSVVEEKFTNQYNIKNIDILKVSHHGSNTSTSLSFLDKIKPNNALISVGANNRYSHPNNDVIERLKIFTNNIYRTDLNGTIFINFKKKVTFFPYKP